MLVCSQSWFFNIYITWRCKYVQILFCVSEHVRRGAWNPTTESEAMTISPLSEDWSPVMGPEEVTVTDITINSLTVTFREALVARGFFRSWELEIWHYRDWGWCEPSDGERESVHPFFKVFFCFLFFALIMRLHNFHHCFRLHLSALLVLIKLKHFRIVIAINHSDND